MASKHYDFVVAGAGIIGLTIARELAERRLGTVCVLEKETGVGMHASGRNSGVVHAGLYYPSGSLKSKVCVEGSKRLAAYAAEKGIAFHRTGKVVVASTPSKARLVEPLYRQAVANGVRVELVDEKKLREIEPEARTCGQAIYSPDTAVIDSKGVLEALRTDLSSLGVEICFGHEYGLSTRQGRLEYGHLINATGQHADRLAHSMGVGKKYRILPFKGMYKKLRPEAAGRFRGLIYPVPDSELPFLGVHLTRTVGGEVMIGPTALPALGRENYGGWKGWSLSDLPFILRDLSIMVFLNQNGLRNMTLDELSKVTASGFWKHAKRLAPSIRLEDILPSEKVGIRAQLVDEETMRLVMDFVIEDGPRSTHILNAVSPAFTSSLAFAQLVADRIEKKNGSFA